MTATLSKVDTALSMASNLSGIAQAPKNSSNLKGRKITSAPFSFYVLIIGAVVGVVAIVAASIFLLIPLIVAGAVLVLTNTLGAYYIYKFNGLKNLEEDVKNLVQAINVMGDIIVKERTNVQQLSKANQEAKNNLAEISKVLENAQIALQSETANVGKATDALKLKENSLLELQQLFDKLKQGTIEIGHQVLEMNKSTNALNGKEKEFLDKITILNALSSQMMSQSTKQDGLNNAFKANIVCLEDFLNNFKQQLASNKEKFDSLTAELSELKSSLDTLTKDKQDIKEVVQKAGDLLANQEKQAAELVEGVSKVNRTTPSRKDLNKLLADAHRLSELQQHATLGTKL